METFLIKAAQLMLSLSILVFIHELGHFFFARLFKVRVEKFYLFFDPWFSLFKYKPKNSDTEYGIGWLPLGGYVKIAGMIDESMDKEQMAQPEKPWEFRSKPAWQRLLIMTAGVINNFLLALVIYAMIAFVWGDTILPIKNIGNGLVYSEVAKNAGFQNGDVPLTADGKTLYDFSGETIRALAEAHEVEVLRNNEVVKLNLPEDLMLQLIGANQRFAGCRMPVVVQSAVAGYGASDAGMQAGDSIIAVNGAATPDYTDFTAALGAHKGASAEISFIRKGEEMVLPVAVNTEGQIGITLVPASTFYPTETIYYGFFESIPKGIKKGFNTLAGICRRFQVRIYQRRSQQFRRIRNNRQHFPLDMELGSFLGNDSIPFYHTRIYEYTAHSGSRRRSCSFPSLRSHRPPQAERKIHGICANHRYGTVVCLVDLRQSQ